MQSLGARFFMIDRTVTLPAGYAERDCLLVCYRLPLLRHCFVLCHEPAVDREALTPSQQMAFCLEEAQRLAYRAVGDEQAFMLIHSGHTIRKRANWHCHIFIVQYRWQKAWLYAVLATKNLVLAGYLAIRGRQSA